MWKSVMEATYHTNAIDTLAPKYCMTYVSRCALTRYKYCGVRLVENHRNCSRVYTLYNYLHPIAIQYLGKAKVRDAVDGPFKSFNGDKGPNMNNPYIGTETLQNDIEKGKLGDILRKEMEDHAFRVYMKKLDDSKNTDVTLLWWKLKQEKDTRHVLHSA